jgi:transcriptional regulator with XRE-family HTH domain
MQKFGEHLKTFRTKRRLTQLELAQRSGVPQPLISDLEAGKREGVTLEMAWRLARELSVSLDHLAGTWEDVAAPAGTEDTAPAEVAGTLGPRRQRGTIAGGIASRRGRPRATASG